MSQVLVNMYWMFLGLSTALVERDDFSSGTSSRSTKLIHGGVRYLQKAIMQLDREQVNIIVFLSSGLCNKFYLRHGKNYMVCCV